MQAIHAAEAGKDFYVQKPMTIYLDEALAVMRAAERHGRIGQVGTQIHAGANYRRVVEWVRSGRLGRDRRGAGHLWSENHGREGDWQRAQYRAAQGLRLGVVGGPDPVRPFNELIVHGASTNCSLTDYSGGYTPGMAPHVIDLPYWALGLVFPLVTTCSGGRYTVRDAGDAYDAQESTWQFPKLTMTWMLSLVNCYGFDFQGKGGIGRRLGAYFHGVNGTL